MRGTGGSNECCPRGPLTDAYTGRVGRSYACKGNPGGASLGVCVDAHGARLPHHAEPGTQWGRVGGGGRCPAPPRSPARAAIGACR